MQAIAYASPGPASVLQSVTLPDPEPRPQDLVVEVQAVSVNPVDVKNRAGSPPGDSPRILGFDAAGIVRHVGPEARGFVPGDRVWYAGDFTRPGSNARLHAVDSRIVAHMPGSLSFGQAAAMPLTTITAWEMLFDRLDVTRPVAGTDAILITGGAGGVSSIAVQLARQLTGMTVVATASRPETREWITRMGAHHVIDHTRPLPEAWKDTGLPAPGFVFLTSHTKSHIGGCAELIAPQGRIGLIENSPDPIDARAFMPKSASLHWELMFTRPRLNTADIAKQGALLARTAALVDAGRIVTTLGRNLGPITAENLQAAHQAVETGQSIGKVVLEGWPD